jgi:predicted NBD/HSP70 family sugar kinase
MDARSVSLSDLPHRLATRGSPLRSTNERAILSVLLKSNVPMNRAAIAETIGLTLQSVSRIVETLIEDDLLYTGQNIERQGRGSPSPSVMVHGAGAYSIGLSITTDRISAGLMDLTGRLLDIHDGFPATSSLGAILDACAALIEGLISAHVPNRDRVVGIGLVMTGFFIDPKRVNPPEQLAALAHIDLPALLQARCRIGVILENDGTAAATAEAFLGVGRRYPTFGYLYFAAGIGGGLIHDGQAIRGWRGNAGEMRSMFPADVVEDRPTLEMLRAMLSEDGLEFATIAAMLDQFDINWPTIDRWIDRALPGLNMIVSAFSAIFDPAAIVLGGRMPVSLAARLIERIEPFTQPRLGMMPPLVPIVTAEVQSDPAVIGGASMPLRAAFFPLAGERF